MLKLYVQYSLASPLIVGKETYAPIDAVLITRRRGEVKSGLRHS